MAVKGQPQEQDALLNQPPPPPTYAASTTPRFPSGPSQLPPQQHIYNPVHHVQPSASHEASVRARKRFLAALFWGFAIWIGVGLITGGIVGQAMSQGRPVERHGRHAGHGHERHGGY